MGKGFFQSDDDAPSKAPIPLLPRCGQCKLYLHCKSPKISIDGEGRKKILLVGEGPGFNEDEEGKPFVGRAGQFLWKSLAKFGMERDDFHIGNAIICRPTKQENGKTLNRTPTDKEIEHCRPNIVKAIKELQPNVIILLGASAVQSVLGWLWKDKVGQISRWDGWRIPDQKINAWICPTYHPSFVMRREGGREEPVKEILFEKHLEAACKLKDRPWKQIPDYKGKIKVVLDPDEAAKEIRRMGRSGLVAFDYENSPLKPDREDAFIHCCSMSDGNTSVAYPMVGAASQATFDVIEDENIGKIASNLKHEHRWSIRFGHMVRNWQWDTMVAAHVLDNRPSISSIKFQAYVRLGQPSWNHYIEPYLKSKGTNDHNRVKQADLRKLLMYCGMDSLMEYKVAMLQMKEMKRRS
jgi:uracil-DNA glycosylase